MTAEQAADRAREAPGSYADLFRSAPDADPTGPGLAAPDESEAAMTRLRAPFDAGPVEAAEHRG
jgi:hypothetical protein